MFFIIRILSLCIFLNTCGSVWAFETISIATHEDLLPFLTKKAEEYSVKNDDVAINLYSFDDDITLRNLIDGLNINAIISNNSAYIDSLKNKGLNDLSQKFEVKSGLALCVDIENDTIKIDPNMPCRKVFAGLIQKRIYTEQQYLSTLKSAFKDALEYSNFILIDTIKNINSDNLILADYVRCYFDDRLKIVYRVPNLEQKYDYISYKALVFIGDNRQITAKFLQFVQSNIDFYDENVVSKN